MVVAFSWRAAEWQNSIRARVEMPPVHSGHPLEVMAIAAAVALVLILLGRLFLWVARVVRRRLARHVPERISRFAGILVAVALFWGIVDGVLLRAFFNAADELFAARDALLEPEHPAPSHPLGTGSAASLIDWETLGRAGREFVASGRPPRASRTSPAARRCGRSGSTPASTRPRRSRSAPRWRSRR